MNRREIITILWGAAASWQVVAHTKQPQNVRRVDHLETLG
jgi:hypothetical protein